MTQITRLKNKHTNKNKKHIKIKNKRNKTIKRSNINGGFNPTTMFNTFTNSINKLSDKLDLIWEKTKHKFTSLNNTPQQLNNTPQQLNNTPQQLNNMPQQLNNMPQQLNNTPQQLNNMPQQLNNMPQQLNNTPQQLNNMPQQLNGGKKYKTIKTIKNKRKIKNKK